MGFAPHPDNESIRHLTLCLCRMTRWGLNEVLDMTYEEALWWLEGVNALEKEIFPDA